MPSSSWYAKPGRRSWVNRDALAEVWVQPSSEGWEVAGRTIAGVTLMLYQSIGTAAEAADFAEQLCR